MVENIIEDRDEMWSELIERARANGVSGQDAWNELVEDYFMERVEVGESDKDDELPEQSQEYKDRWMDAMSELGIE